MNDKDSYNLGRIAHALEVIAEILDDVRTVKGDEPRLNVCGWMEISEEDKTDV